jgi:hypothetical protein
VRFPLSRDLAIALERRIDELANARPIADSYQHKIVTEHRALPLYLGRQGYCAIALTGDVLEFDWRNFNEPTPMLPRGRAYAGIVLGSMKYPELRVLLPVRQGLDTICEACGGSGHHPLGDRDPRVVCDCGGLGFVPSRWPNGDPAAPPYAGNVFPEHITPTSYRSDFTYEICAEHHVQTDAAARGLFEALYDEPERKFYYYRAKEHPARTKVDNAIDAGAIVEGAHEFYYYARDVEKCDYPRIEPHTLDVSGVECLFAFEKELLLWLGGIAAGPMYFRTELRLSERGRRDIEKLRRDSEAQARADDQVPFEVKPGFGGVSVDILRLWPWMRRRVQEWRQRRAERKQLR